MLKPLPKFIRKSFFSAMVLLTAHQVSTGQTVPKEKLGVNLELKNAYVDMARQERAFSKAVGEGSANVDAIGWPTEDFAKVFWDYRSYGAWWGADQIQDPEKYHTDMTGTWKLSFTGQADISINEGIVTFQNKTYDPGTNKTKVDLVVNYDANNQSSSILYLKFTNTKKTNASDVNTGITDIKLIRPGYSEATTQTFTNDFYAAICPFGVLRSMDLTHTNTVVAPGEVFDTSKKVYQSWSDRKSPTAVLLDQGRGGLPWEYLIEIANTADKDVWINIPVNADQSYLTGLAKLFKEKLEPGRKIYFEYGNENWNYGGAFLGAYQWNIEMAKREVTSNPNSNLKVSATETAENDGRTWGLRRHFRRSKEIWEAFKTEYGAEAFGTTIRPIASWFVLAPTEYDNTLNWMKNHFGDPKNYLYGIGITGYYGNNGTNRSTVDELVTLSLAAADGMVNTAKDYKTLADKWGIKITGYEGSPHFVGPANIGNKILANRAPGYKEVVKKGVGGWFNVAQGDVFIYFGLVGNYSEHGTWGLSDDILPERLKTSVKYQAILELTNTTSTCPFNQNTTNLEKSNATNLYSIFPIPAKDELYIESTVYGSEGFSYALTDVAGKVIMSKKADRGQEIEMLDLSSLNNGIYFLTVGEAGARQTEKIVISK